MASRSIKQKPLLQHFWGFLTSRKVAVVLLLVTLAMLSLSLWIPQVPADLDAADLEQWWTLAREQHGPRLDLYERLGLLYLFRTPTFLALLAALLLSTLLCTLDRLGRLWRVTTCRPAIRLPDPAYDKAHWQMQDVSPERARRALRRFGYCLWEESSEGQPHFFHCETFRLPRLGTVLTHLGLFLFVVAALLHTQLAWRERLLLDPPAPGQNPVPAHLRHHPNCTVLNTGFQVHRDERGFRGFQSELLVQEGDSTVQTWSGPAAPLSACGANFYLDSYGLAIYVEAVDDMGYPFEVRFSEQDAALLRFTEGTTEASFEVPDLSLHATVAPSWTALVGLTETIVLRLEQAGLGALLLEGNVSPTATIGVLEGQLKFHSGHFVSVEAVHDPGFTPFWAGGVALALGSGLTLLVPRRRLWAQLDEEGTLRVRFDTGNAELQQERIAALSRRLRPTAGGES